MDAPRADRHAWPPTLIVGAPRSGTTLLAVMLANHSRLAVGPETHFFHTFLPRALKTAKGNADHLLTLAGQDRRIRDLGIPIDDVRDRLPANDRGPGAVFIALMEAYAASVAKPIWCEKSPDHIFHADRILRYLPSARFVVCLRDGRDVAMSLANVPWRSGSLWGHAFMWVRAARAMEKIRYELGPGRFMLVRYEELVTEPDRTVAAVCDYLGIAFEPQMLNAGPRPTSVIPERERAWKGKASERPDPSRVGAWRLDTSVRQRCVLNLVEGPYLQRLGYGEVDIDNCPPSLRAEHLVRRFAELGAIRRIRRRFRRRSPSP